MPERCPVCLYHGEELARYSFGRGHPFGPDRLDAFWTEARRQGLDRAACLRGPVMADREILERFHTPAYVQRVKALSLSGQGYLDEGDTPAFPGIYEAAATVVGTTLDAVGRLMSGECRRAFVPIAGLHHARRDRAAGFCVFNDCGVAIETLLAEHGLERVGYVDIDAHHGDGVYYSFEDNPGVIFADLHEDGRFLYPGTGRASEAGTGPAFGTKLNVPMPPLAGDGLFRRRWAEVEAFLGGHAPQIVLFQCGADSLAGDPITDMQYSVAAHRLAAERLRRLADEFCEGRIVALGGGGYNRRNLATAWSAVVKALLRAS